MKRLLLVFMACIGLFSFLAADTIASWALTSNGTATSVAAYATAGAYTGGAGIGAITYGSSGAYANGWSTGAIDLTDYFEVSVAPNTGYALNITELQFGERRSATGIRDYQVRWSTDNFATFTTISTQNVPDDTNTRTADLTALGITVSAGQTLKFRWYGYTSEATTGTWRIANASLNIIGSGVPLSSPSLAATPSAINYGTVASSASAVQSYSLSGLNLTGAPGNITVTAPYGFLVCATEAGTYETSITIPYTSATLDATPVYVKFTPDEVRAYSEEVTNAGGGASVDVTVTGDSRLSVTNITADAKVPASGADLFVSATITAGGRPYTARVYYTVNGGTEQYVDMADMGGNEFAAYVPAQADGARVNYYVKVTDSVFRSEFTGTVTNIFWGNSPISINSNSIKTPNGSGVGLYTGYYCRVVGVATVSSGVLATTNLSVYLQDSEGGLNVYKAGSTFAMTAGNRYSVVGMLTNYSGLLELVPDAPATDITDLGASIIPAPAVITAAQFAANREYYEGRLITINNCLKVSGTWPSGTTFANTTLTDDSGTSNFQIRINATTGGTEPTWPQDVTGLGCDYNTGCQVFPRSTADFTASPFIPETVASGSTDPVTFDGMSLSFPGGATAGSTLAGYQYSDTPTTYGDLPGTIVTLIPNRYWVINSSAGAIGTYTITFDLSGIPGLSSFNTVRILKRANDQSPWVDVADLGGTYSYASPYITISGLASFSHFVPASTGDQTLPVTLSAFTASQTDANYVSIAWTTQSETDMRGYKILRSSENSLTNAAPICDLVNAVGVTNAHTYTVTDIDVTMNSTYYYWVEYYDLFGHSGYYGPVSVTLSNDPGEDVPDPVFVDALRSCYPNPFNPTANIEFSVANNGTPVVMHIYNVKGQVVRTINAGTCEKGIHSLQWNGDDSNNHPCASGLYFVKVMIGNQPFMRQVSMLK
jgi:hypothetical protein